MQLIAAALCVASLGGCSRDAAQFRFDDYKARLARSLKLDAPQLAEPVEPVRRPRKRDLVVEQAAADISFLDFVRLNRCALGEVIGQRNSVLGKVAPASQRLFNDLEFLRLAPECIVSLRDRQDDALAETLIEATAHKRKGLAISIANATLASEEFSSLWRVPSSLDRFPGPDAHSVIDELRYVESEVARWLSGDYAHDSVRFERALGALRRGDAGSLLAAAGLTHAELDAADRMARKRRAGRPICFNGRPADQGRILRQVVDRFFIGEIQVWLARVNVLSYDLLTPYRALEAHLETAQSPAYRQWRRQRDMQLAWLTSASRKHVQTIRPILASCGLAPGD